MRQFNIVHETVLSGKSIADCMSPPQANKTIHNK